MLQRIGAKRTFMLNGIKKRRFSACIPCLERDVFPIDWIFMNVKKEEVYPLGSILFYSMNGYINSPLANHGFMLNQLKGSLYTLTLFYRKST